MKSTAFKNPKNKKQSSLSVPEKLRMYVSRSMFYPTCVFDHQKPQEKLNITLPGSQVKIIAHNFFDSQKVQEKMSVLLPGSQVKAITPQQMIVDYKGYLLTYLACDILEDIISNKRVNGKVVFSLQKIYSPALTKLE